MSASSTTTPSNIIPFPRKQPPAAPPRPHGVRVLKQGKYCLAHCLQSGVIHERYWDQFLELARIIEECQR
jgi:hypothetical protein